MFAAIAALLPVFLLIAFGWGLKRFGMPGDDFWPPAERLIYFVFFPALLVHTLANADLGGFRVAPMAGAMLGAIFAMAIIAVTLRRRLRLGDAAFTSLFQGMIRSNSYVALAGAGAVLGEVGLTLASIATAFVVPTVNVLSVVALAHYAEGQRPSLRGIARLLLRNPLLIACAAGVALNVSGIGLPGGLDDLVAIIGRATLPLALIAVGAGLSLGSLNSTRDTVVGAALFKLIGLPLLVAAGCWVFGVEGVTRSVAILFTAMPTAPSSYVLARQLGGDADLMASIVTASTLAALVTLPIIVTIFV